MPKRRDIKNILIIGAGPIIIGQACEFDYSGTQACKALKEEGYRVILVNSNPATIMTDPDTADVVYIEPLTVAMLEKIIHKEHIDTILPTLGGQTALNLAMRLAEAGVLERYRVKLIGADVDVIHKAEDREAFKQAMAKIKLDTPRSATVTDLASARQVARDIGYPCIVRPAFTMGGTGGGIAHSEQELEAIVASGLQNSLITQVLLEESIIGWKEFELEVMRDKNDNVVIICSIENLDPMGVHTGDSITVAPVQTLTDQEYQLMRNAAIAIMAEIGVETGGSNVQFAFHPQTGRMIVIEMNPRVSRSSALASKATGFPIAKLAAKLAVGYTLDELKNDITKETPACFEPTIDYVVTKIPRFNFEKFPRTPSRLGTVMKSVGETMAIGRTFKESLQKGLRSLETKRHGFGYDGRDLKPEQLNQLIEKLKTPNAERLFYIKQAFETGMIIEQVYKYTQIDPWFLYHMKQIVDTTQDLTDTEESIREAKEMGFSDHQLARLLGYENELAFRRRREELEIRPVYKLVDTCSGEFEAYTPYYYSTY
ncbi:MAG TPA: carbamoyl-phosphate synthase large subunit, partial [Candidatus Obscuribacterales bacterium]